MQIYTSMADIKEELQLAEELIGKKKYDDALQFLVKGFVKDPEKKKLYQMAAECLYKMEAPDEAALFEKAYNNFDSFDAFNDLGANYFRVNRFDLAMPFLEKAWKLSDKNPYVAHDLAVVYARMFKIDKAIQVIEQADPYKDFWNLYYWCKLNLLQNRTDGVQPAIQELLTFIENELKDDEQTISNNKIFELVEMSERLVSIENPQNIIYEWQFIQYGTMMLDLLNTSEKNLIGGRYIMKFGTYENIGTTLYKCKNLLSKLEYTVQEVKYLATPDSEILGKALARILQVNSTQFKPTEESKGCLIVAAHTSDYDIYPDLPEIKEGQLTFALNHNWLASSYICPDIIGFMSQKCSLPWEEGSNGKSENNEDSIARAVDKLLAQTSDANVSDEILNFYLERKHMLKGIGAQAGKLRSNFHVESPVTVGR